MPVCLWVLAVVRAVGEARIWGGWGFFGGVGVGVGEGLVGRLPRR